MKKIILSALVLTSYFSIHASESQLWFGKNKTVGIAAVSVATATGLFAALNLWAWNNWRNDEDAAQKKIDAAAQLKKQKADLENITTSAQKIHARHMAKTEVLADGEVATLKTIDNAPGELSQFLHAYERYRKPSHGGSVPCDDCLGVYNGDAYDRVRTNACPVFLAAYSPFINAMGQQQVAVQQRLESANALLPAQEKALKKAKTNKRFVARNGLISASVAAASLGALYWNKTRA